MIINVVFIPTYIANSDNRYDNQTMEYMDVKEASRKWGITDRRIRILCNEGRVDGAIRLGWSWTIPKDTPKPRDGRVLRRFKNLDIRPGNVDIARLESLMITRPIDKSLKSNQGLNDFLASVLYSLLLPSATPMKKEEITSVLFGSIVPNLSLKEHLVVINFKSIFLSLIDKKDRWFERDVKEIYVRLLQGIDDIDSDSYRDGFTRYAIRDKEKVRVPVQMETLFSQYENSWKNLHGMISAVLLYGELLRIEPFSEYQELFAYLILSGELLRCGILPPLITEDIVDESKATFSLALKRGNYSEFTHLIERAVVAAYGVLC